MTCLIRNFLIVSTAAVGMFILVGCGEKATSTPASAVSVGQQDGKPSGSAKAIEGEHGHAPSAHGGMIVPIGKDNYHAEAIFDKDGVLRLYMLGNDESKIIEVEAQVLTAFVKIPGGSESTSIVIKPEPQAGDGKGRTSHFVGKLPRELWGKQVEVTIPTININGERFRVGFKSFDDAHQETSMPKGLDDSEERKLFLTPGGIYTEADIKANGSMTGSQKFKGVMAAHDAKPQPGDKICPISETKANPKFSWVIGGKTYEFCCPPCVEEFVKMAKEKPQNVKAPEEYRKK